MRTKKKLIRACTVSDSIGFVEGLVPDLAKEYELCVLASPGKHWAQLDKYGNSVRRIEVPMERHISPLRDLVSLWRLVRVFRCERPDMVHSMTPKAGLLCMMAAWLCRVPVRVHTFTGLVFPTAKGLTQKLLIFTDRLTCACATHVNPEGEGVKRDLAQFHITDKPLRILGHGNVKGIDLQRFDSALPEVQAESAKIRKPGVFTFIAIGRLVGDKGINELVEAFSHLNRDLPDTRLILVGPQEAVLDPLSPDTLAEIDRNPAIEAVGPQSDVRPWLAAADCHVLASYREGFPNVVIEAGAMGLPQIVTDINGANEIIINGRNGVIVSPRSSYAIQAAMYRMATDPNQRTSLAANARQLISSRYEQTYVRHCLYNFYKEIIEK